MGCCSRRAAARGAAAWAGRMAGLGRWLPAALLIIFGPGRRAGAHAFHAACWVHCEADLGLVLFFPNLRLLTMVSGRTVAALLLCSLALGASWEAGEAAALRPARQLLQSGFFEPGVSGGGGGWGGGRRRGGGAASATCQGDAEGLLPDAKTEIQQAVAKAFQQCTLVPCRPEASGVAPVSGSGGSVLVEGEGAFGAWWPSSWAQVANALRAMRKA